MGALLLPSGCPFIGYGICILGTRKSIFLDLLFLLWRTGAQRRICSRIIKVGRIVPAMRTAFAASVALAIILLILRVPELAVTSPTMRRSYGVGGRDEARCLRILTILQGLVLESRLRQAFLIAACPLRAAFLTFDGTGIDETVTLSPFWGTAMILIVADILKVEVVNVA